MILTKIFNMCIYLHTYIHTHIYVYKTKWYEFNNHKEVYIYNYWTHCQVLKRCQVAVMWEVSFMSSVWQCEGCLCSVLVEYPQFTTLLQRDSPWPGLLLKRVNGHFTSKWLVDDLKTEMMEKKRNLVPHKIKIKFLRFLWNLSLAFPLVSKAYSSFRTEFV